MNYLKFAFFLLIFSITLNSPAQLEIDSDSEHAVSYEVKNDTVRIFIEVFNDFSIDLDSDQNLDVDDDFVYLMFDLKSNGMDLSGDVDKLYTYDSSKTKNICDKYISSPSSAGICEEITGGRATVELKATSNNVKPHLFYSFSIPKSELEFNSNSALCGRISVKIHTNGSPLKNAVTFPTQIDAFEYYLTPFNSIQLYPEAAITFSNGDLAPDDKLVSVCVGDTLKVSKSYPRFHWNALSQNYYQIILDIPIDEYYFKISDVNDENCIYTDTISINLVDQSLCQGAYKFPNIVTPNNDNYNDVFELMIGQELLGQGASFWKGSKLEVFNRWGDCVYKTKKGLKGEHPRWDLRKENGSLVPAGTYYYIYITPGDSPQRVNGFFTVLHDE